MRKFVALVIVAVLAPAQALASHFEDCILDGTVLTAPKIRGSEIRFKFLVSAAAPDPTGVSTLPEACATYVGRKVKVFLPASHAPQLVRHGHAKILQKVAEMSQPHAVLQLLLLPPAGDG